MSTFALTDKGHQASHSFRGR